MGRAARPVLPAGKSSLGMALAGAGRAALLGAAPSITRLCHRHHRDPMPRPAGGRGKRQWSWVSPEKATGAPGRSWDPGSPVVGTARTPGDTMLPSRPLVRAAGQKQDKPRVLLPGSSSHLQAKQRHTCPRCPQGAGKARSLLLPQPPVYLVCWAAYRLTFASHY